MNNAENDILNDFVEEGKELLQNIEEDFLQLEKNATPELTNKVFRAIHTIKGGAGFVGLHNISKLSHVIENILSKVRSGIFKINSSHIDIFLSGVDVLKKMVLDVENSNSLDIAPILEKLLKLEEISTNDKTSFPENIEKEKPGEIHKPSEIDTKLDPELIKDFVFEGKKYLNTIDNSLNIIKKNNFTGINDELSKIYKAFDVLSGTSKIVGLNTISTLTRKISLIIKDLLNNKFLINSSIYSAIFSGFDKTYILLDDAFSSNSRDIQNILSELDNLNSDKKSNSGNKPVTQNKDLAARKSSHPVENEQVANEIKIIDKTETVRLNVNILDKLMQLAGELVLVRNQQLSVLENTPGINREVIQRLNSITSEIQETVMQTRLQPIGIIFNKFPRVVRELSSSLNKKIELIISGSEVELDKTILEAIAAPLVHIIRNSADHGIELPEERTATGKPTQGTITLNATHESGFINIIIADDGRGIDAFMIRNKVLEKGIKTQPELDKMNENELLSLIFLPGFSTSQNVSDISGRGVGMDVVKTSIEKLSGFIDINSVVGKGTVITLKLPLTLAIIPCLIVGYADYRFAIPQINIEELVTVFSNNENKIEHTGEQEVYRLRNKLLPIVRLSEILNRSKKFDYHTKNAIIKKYHENKENSSDSSIKKLSEFAVIRYGNQRYGLVFDCVIGTEEIVVKPLHQALKEIRIFSGATILGDGKISPIIDIEGIANHANIDFHLKEKVQEQKVASKNGKIETILLFKNGISEQFAVPVSLLKRIEPFKSKDIEFVAGKEFITINGISHNIIRLEKIISVSPCVEAEDLYLILIKYINRPVGLLFSQLIDIQNSLVNINTQSYTEDGIIGTSVINNKMTLFIDTLRIIELSAPHLYDRNLIKINKMHAELPVSENLSILVVDDSTVFRQMITNYLTKDGYEVTAVSSGVSALQFLKEKKFDLMISDIEMPEMNGFELIENVRSGIAQKEIPAIALSSNTNESIIRQALKSGFDEYLVKIDKEQLINTIKKMLIYKDKPEVIIYTP